MGTSPELACPGPQDRASPGGPRVLDRKSEAGECSYLQISGGAIDCRGPADPVMMAACPGKN